MGICAGGVTVGTAAESGFGRKALNASCRPRSACVPACPIQIDFAGLNSLTKSVWRQAHGHELMHASSCPPPSPTLTCLLVLPPTPPLLASTRPPLPPQIPLTSWRSSMSAACSRSKNAAHSGLRPAVPRPGGAPLKLRARTARMRRRRHAFGAGVDPGETQGMCIACAPGVLPTPMESLARGRALTAAQAHATPGPRPTCPRRPATPRARRSPCQATTSGRRTPASAAAGRSLGAAVGAVGTMRGAAGGDVN